MYLFFHGWQDFLCFTLDAHFIMSFILSFTNFNILSPDTKFVGWTIM